MTNAQHELLNDLAGGFLLFQKMLQCARHELEYRQGGHYRFVHGNTVHLLLVQGLIECNQNISYRITDAGRNALLKFAGARKKKRSK